MRRLLVEVRHLVTAPLLACALLSVGASAAHADDRSRPPLVAAAANLRVALEEILTGFERTTGSEVRVAYGSSGNFARQIERGAPYELFLSADEAYVLQLADRGLTRDRGEIYAIGRIALYAAQGSPIDPAQGLEGLGAWLATHRGRLAIANPEHAPYGRAAEQALRTHGLWDAIQPRLLYGENVAQAAQYASSGDADGAIVAWSLVVAPPLRERGSSSLLPESLHDPLRQRMVLLKPATAAAGRLYEHLRSPAARAVFERNGFGLPGD